MPHLSMTAVIAVAMTTAGLRLPTAHGQCGFEWKPGNTLPSLNGIVNATVVYDDGSGPALYVGGSFTIAGNVLAASIAKWDGNSWSALGSGITHPSCSGCTPVVYALAVYNGNLIAGGDFNTAGGISANDIAQWDGSS